MQIQLKPCPFCGSRNIRNLPAGYVKCLDCECRGPDSAEHEMAALYWNAASLEWTKTRPKKPGFYFYKTTKGKVVVTHIERLELVHWNGVTGVMMVNGEAEQQIDFLNGLWAGPIPEPAE